MVNKDLDDRIRLVLDNYTNKDHNNWLASALLDAIYHEDLALHKVFSHNDKVIITVDKLTKLEHNINRQVLAELPNLTMTELDTYHTQVAKHIVHKLSVGIKNNKPISFSNLAIWSKGATKYYKEHTYTKLVPDIEDKDLAYFKEVIDSLEHSEYDIDYALRMLYDMIKNNRNADGLPIFKRADSARNAFDILYNGKKLTPYRLTKLLKSIVNTVDKEKL